MFLNNFTACSCNSITPAKCSLYNNYKRFGIKILILMAKSNLYMLHFTNRNIQNKGILYLTCVNLTDLMLCNHLCVLVVFA